MSITTTITALPNRSAAERFMILVANLVAMAVGTDSSVQVGAAPVQVWRPRVDVWVLELLEYTDEDGDPFATRAANTVAINHGGDRVWQVTSGPAQAQHSYGEFRGIDAAMAVALDVVTRPIWQPIVVATAMNEHDACGC